MINPINIKNTIISLLDKEQIDYKLFEHKPVLSYEDSVEVQREAGYEGTEGKSLVLKTDDTFIVYVTIMGKKVNFAVIKETLGVKKIRLATPEELQEHFGAVPGCAYPFGFDETYAIYVDPTIYEQPWFIFSPALPTYTVQVHGEDLKKVFNILPNKVTEVKTFNLA